MLPRTRQAVVVVDLGYGDSGKGTITDYLTRKHKAHTIIRFNGGAQAAHNVITPDGRHHTFAQLGSGMFLPGVQTYLSQFMLLEPYAMFNEAAHLQAQGVTDVFTRTFIDCLALVTTPYHQAANRLRELARGADRHGSCGMGIGETVADHLKYGKDVIFAGDMPDKATLRKKLRFIRDGKWAEIRADCGDFLRDSAAKPHVDVFTDDSLIEIAADNYAYLAEQITLVDDRTLKTILSRDGTVIFEGAQGVLLDEDYGFAPYTTWSKTTFNYAKTLLESHPYTGEITRLGVLRTYFTRHGAGPFVTEDTELTQILPEHHNTLTPWQESFRRGYFDLVAARYAVEVAGQVDALALTHLDYLPLLPALQICPSYHFQGDASALTGYFAHEGQNITGICVQHPPDIAHQTQLSRLLLQCNPQYHKIEDSDAYLTAIEQSLNIPITLTSHGPTASEKTNRQRVNDLPDGV